MPVSGSEEAEHCSSEPDSEDAEYCKPAIESEV